MRESGKKVQLRLVILHLPLVPASLRDIPGQCCPSPTSTGRLRQAACGYLAPVLTIEAVAARSPARRKLVTPGATASTHSMGMGPSGTRHLLLLAQASWQSPLLFFKWVSSHKVHRSKLQSSGNVLPCTVRLVTY